MSQKRRKQVRCTLCTSHRWRGNSRERLSGKDAARKQAAEREIEEVGT
jgi:hypothetical protein